MRKIEARGTFRSIGVQIGYATTEDLHFVRDRTIAYLLANCFVRDLQRMREIALRYVASTHDFFPEAIDYLKGLAWGGALSLEDVALIAFSEEIRAEAGPGPSRCSTLAVPTPDGWVIAHNEDYEPQYAGRMIVADLRFMDCPRVISLNYPGHFPCLAGSLNECGIAITNNSLWMDAVPGLSKNAKHFRASLAREMHQALDDLTFAPNAVSTHYTLAWGGMDQLVGIEVSDPATTDSPLHVIDPAGQAYAHTNHVRFMELKSPDPALADGNHSKARLDKLEALAAAGAPCDPASLLELFSTADGLLHRAPGSDPSSVTLATVIIRPKMGEIWFRDADPSAEPRDLKFTL
jgi:hypothetical protein